MYHHAEPHSPSLAHIFSPSPLGINQLRTHIRNNLAEPSWHLYNQLYLSILQDNPFSRSLADTMHAVVGENPQIVAHHNELAVTLNPLMDENIFPIVLGDDAPNHVHDTRNRREQTESSPLDDGLQSSDYATSKHDTPLTSPMHISEDEQKEYTSGDIILLRNHTSQNERGDIFLRNHTAEYASGDYLPNQPIEYVSGDILIPSQVTNLLPQQKQTPTTERQDILDSETDMWNLFIAPSFFDADNLCNEYYDPKNDNVEHDIGNDVFGEAAIMDDDINSEDAESQNAMGPYEHRVRKAENNTKVCARFGVHPREGCWFCQTSVL